MTEYLQELSERLEQEEAERKAKEDEGLTEEAEAAARQLDDTEGAEASKKDEEKEDK